MPEPGMTSIGAQSGAGMGGGGDQYREEPGPESLLSGERVSDVRGGLSLSGQVLGKVEQRLGVKTNKLNDLAHVISGIESSYGKNLFNPTSTAKGIYQFTDDSFETAKQRLSNVLGFLPDRIKNVPTVDKLLADDQKALFFAHLSENTKGFRDGGGSDKRMIEYIKGNSSGESLYINDHYKGKPDKATQKLMDEFFKSSTDNLSMRSFYLDEEPSLTEGGLKRAGEEQHGAGVQGLHDLLTTGTVSASTPWGQFRLNAPQHQLDFRFNPRRWGTTSTQIQPFLSVNPRRGMIFGGVRGDF